MTTRDTTCAITRPVLVGPVTLLLLARPETTDAPGTQPFDRLNDVVDLYIQLLTALKDAGIPWVELDEHALAAEGWDVPRDTIIDALTKAYTRLSFPSNRPDILVAVGYGDAGEAAQLGLAATDISPPTKVDRTRYRLPPTHLQIHSAASIQSRETRTEHHPGLSSSNHSSRLSRHEIHRRSDINLPSRHWRCHGLLQSVFQRRFRLGLNTTAGCAMFLEVLGCRRALDIWHLFTLHAVVPISS